MTFSSSSATFLSRPLTSIARFLKREDGAVAIEAAIMLPLLGFAYVSGFAYFDNYRREVLLTKATYTVADILSRETGAVTAVDFEGMQDLFEFLTFSEGRTRLRFTQIERVAGQLEVTTTVPGVPDTYGTDGSIAMTNAQLETIRHRVPRMEDGQVIVLTESFTTHDPIFGVGLKEREYHRIAPTRNRVIERLVFDLATTAPVEVTPPFDHTDLPAPSIITFDTIALLAAPDPTDDPSGYNDSTGNNGNNGNGDNGWGNGDQDAPGNSGSNNNAENSDAFHQIFGAGSGSTLDDILGGSSGNGNSGNGNSGNGNGNNGNGNGNG